MIDKAIMISIHALLAILGAAARQLRRKDIKAIKVTRFLSGCFIAAFAGIMTYFIGAELGWSANMACAIAGVSGWAGPEILDLIADKMTQAAGLKKG